MPRELGVCVLGAGDMGRTHLAAWGRADGVRVLGVTDEDETRARAAAEQHGVARWFTDLGEGLAQEGVDIVSVCLPSHLHREASTAAMQGGKDVLCEKPIALTVADAQAMIACREATGRKLGIAFCKRHLPQLARLRDWLADGTLGRPVLYRMSGGVEIRFKRWIMDRHMGGGPVIDLCCHYFDQWRWLFGAEPVRVMAMGMSLARGAEELPGVELQTDTATLCVQYVTGDVGAISLSWGLPRGTSAPGAEQVLGPRGVATVHGFDRLTLVRGGGEEETLAGLDADMYGRQAAAFARAVRGDTAPETGAEDGLTALRVSLAVLESIETGRAVELG